MSASLSPRRKNRGFVFDDDLFGSARNGTTRCHRHFGDDGTDLVLTTLCRGDIACLHETTWRRSHPADPLHWRKASQEGHTSRILEVLLREHVGRCLVIRAVHISGGDVSQRLRHFWIPDASASIRRDRWRFESLCFGRRTRFTAPFVESLSVSTGYWKLCFQSGALQRTAAVSLTHRRSRFRPRPRIRKTYGMSPGAAPYWTLSPTEGFDPRKENLKRKIWCSQWGGIRFGQTTTGGFGSSEECARKGFHPIGDIDDFQSTVDVVSTIEIGNRNISVLSLFIGVSRRASWRRAEEDKSLRGYESPLSDPRSHESPKLETTRSAYFSGKMSVRSSCDHEKRGQRNPPSATPFILVVRGCRCVFSWIEQTWRFRPKWMRYPRVDRGAPRRDIVGG